MSVHRWFTLEMCWALVLHSVSSYLQGNRSEITFFTEDTIFSPLLKQDSLHFIWRQRPHMRIKTSVLVMFENVGSYTHRIKPESYLQSSRSDYPPTWVFPEALTVRHNNAEMPFCVKQIHSNYHQAVLITLDILTLLWVAWYTKQAFLITHSL